MDHPKKSTKILQTSHYTSMMISKSVDLLFINFERIQKKISPSRLIYIYIYIYINRNTFNLLATKGAHLLFTPLYHHVLSNLVQKIIRVSIWLITVRLKNILTNFGGHLDFCRMLFFFSFLWKSSI